MSRGAITSALGGHAAAAQRTKQGRVSAFTSRHQQQNSSPAATLDVMQRPTDMAEAARNETGAN